jgi:hypothetical protein
MKLSQYFIIMNLLSIANEQIYSGASLQSAGKTPLQFIYINADCKKLVEIQFVSIVRNKSLNRGQTQTIIKNFGIPAEPNDFRGKSLIACDGSSRKTPLRN